MPTDDPDQQIFGSRLGGYREYMSLCTETEIWRS